MKTLFLCVAVLLSSGVHGFQSHQPRRKESSSIGSFRKERVVECVNQAVALAFLSASLLTTQPAWSVSDDVYGSLETAIIEASDATYPILQSLTSESISPLANKVATIVSSKIPAEKLTKALDTTANTILSIPDEKLDTFVSTVKKSYEGLSVDSCTNTIPIPSAAGSVLANSEAVSKLDSEKVKQVTDKVVSPLAQAVPYTVEKGICLPSKEGLEQVWIGQTKLVLSIPTPVKQQFAADLVPALKSVPNADLLRLLPEGKKVLAGVDRKVANKFQQAGQSLDKVFKQDSRLKAFQ